MLIVKVETLRAACCVAGVDGEISDAEERLLRELKETAGVGEASFRAMKDMAVTERAYYERLFVMLEPDPEQVLTQLGLVAAADGEISSHEERVLRHFAEKLSFGEERTEALIRSMNERAGRVTPEDLQAEQLPDGPALPTPASTPPIDRPDRA